MQAPTFVNHLNQETQAELLKQLPHNENDTKEIIGFIAIGCVSFPKWIMQIISYLHNDYMSDNTELNLAYLLDCIAGEMSEADTTYLKATKEIHQRIADNRSRW